MPRLIALALLSLATPAAAAPFTIVETGEGFAHLQDALMAKRGQDFTVLIAPGVYRECAIQQAGRVTFKAAEPGTAIFESACEGKAALVLRGAARGRWSTGWSSATSALATAMAPVSASRSAT